MIDRLSRTLAVLLMLVSLMSPVWATCGGGGGGGTGGVGGGGANGPVTPVYHVPWKMWDGKSPLTTGNGMVLYWFPASNDELKRSSLLSSRLLTLYSAQCVSMSVVDFRTPELKDLIGDSKPPVAVLANGDGSVIKKVENTGGKLKVDQVEKVVDAEMKQRESTLDQQLKTAKEKAKVGDNPAAIEAFKSVANEKCLFPKKAKDAAKELKKLGVQDVGSIPDLTPIFDRAQSMAIENVMR